MTNGTQRVQVAVAALMLIAGAGPGVAQERQVGPDRYAVAVRGADLHPATPQAAQRTLARIAAAARTACGGSRDSLREIQQTVGQSTCWRRAVADSVAAIDDPMLTQVHRTQP